MDKKLAAYVCIVVLFIMGVFVFLSVHYDAKELGYQGVYTPMQPNPAANSDDRDPRYPVGIHFIAGICALLLVGYLFWTLYRKVQQTVCKDLAERKRSLYKISLQTGQTEYDLFRKSAKDWAVSDDRINQDFISYTADQRLPYYVKDFVNKNYKHIDESLIKKEDIKPTSWRDWAKALLVFPGWILLLFFMVLVLKNIRFTPFP